MICLDIGGTSIRAGLVTLGSEPPVTDRLRTATLAHQGGPAVLRRAEDLAAQLAQRTPEAGGIAVASAGVIDPRTGAVRSATDLIPGWAGTEVGEVLEQQMGIRCTVLNDVHAHGVGEFLFGQGAGCSSALIVAVGTGLGGSFFSGGELLRGANGYAGHIGHIHHGAAAGLKCTCGRTGHLESVASGSGITDRYADLKGPQDPQAEDGAAVVELASAGIEAAEEVLRTAGFSLGESLGSLANAWDPERIIMTGSVTQAGQMWWHQLEAGYASASMRGLRQGELLQGALGDDAPLLGSAAAHRDSERRTTSS